MLHSVAKLSGILFSVNSDTDCACFPEYVHVHVHVLYMYCTCSVLSCVYWIEMFVC